MITHQSKGFAFVLIYMPTSKAQDGGMESGKEIKERERSHRRRQARRELKVEEELEGPQRETVPLRLKCESQQGHLIIEICVASVRLCAFSCHEVLTSARLWDLQLVCGPYPLTPCLIHN